VALHVKILSQYGTVIHFLTLSLEPQRFIDNKRLSQYRTVIHFLTLSVDPQRFIENKDVLSTLNHTTRGVAYTHKTTLLIGCALSAH